MLSVCAKLKLPLHTERKAKKQGEGQGGGEECREVQSKRLAEMNTEFFTAS